MSDHSEHETTVVPRVVQTERETPGGAIIPTEKVVWKPYCVDCDEEIDDE